MGDDELSAEADEPPDDHNANFRKTSIQSDTRKQSLLTRALHTDSESHDEEHEANRFRSFGRQTSRSSTCSTYSGRAGFTSDEGLVSSGTRASTPPSSPPKQAQFKKPDFASFQPASSHAKADSIDLSQSPKHNSASASITSSEPAVEAELGRKRCITFSCGRQNTDMSKGAKPESKEEAKPAEPAKRH